MRQDTAYLRQIETFAKEASQRLFAKSSVVATSAEEGQEFDGAPTVQVLVVLNKIDTFDAVAWANLDLELQSWLRSNGIDRLAYSRVLSQEAMMELQDS